MAVVQVPERDPSDDIRVLAEQAEKLPVLLRLPLQHLRWTAVSVRIHLGELLAVLATIRPPAGAWNQGLLPGVVRSGALDR